MMKRVRKSFDFVIKILLKISKFNLLTKQNKDKPSGVDFSGAKQY